MIKEKVKAPLFKLPSTGKNDFNLKDALGNYIIIYFYPKDDIKSHHKFKKKFKIKFDLLSDEKIDVIKKYKVWGKKKFMGREFMGIIRSTFLIDKKGKVFKIWKNVKVKNHAIEVLNALEGLNK